MLISVKTHNAFVALLQSQIAELRHERDFYRQRWTEKETGASLKPYIEPGSEARAIAQAAEETMHSEAQRVKEFSNSLDWTERLILDDWARANAPEQDAFTAWLSRYGTARPGDVLAE